VFLQFGDDLERRVTEDQSRLVACLPIALDDIDYSGAVDRHETAYPAQHRPQGVSGRREELHRIARDVFGNDPPVPVEDRSSWRGQRNRPEAVGFGFELELVVLNDLGTEEGSREQYERADENEAGNVGTLSETVGVEAVHESSRIENMLRNVISTMSANPAVVRACNGL
jgi:hypothetical protein